MTCSAQLHLSHDPRAGPHCGSLGNCVADICMSKLTFFRGDGETLLKSGFGQRGHTFFFFFLLHWIFVAACRFSPVVVSGSFFLGVLLGFLTAMASLAGKVGL